MIEVNVLVVFYSRYGAAERLALAAGVGALQGRANIRLRRLADDADEASADTDPVRRQELDRMSRDYVVPRPADPVWADAIVFAAPEKSSGQVEAYIASLEPHGAGAGKIAGLLSVDRNDVTLASMHAAAASTGFLVVPATARSGDAVADARDHGRQVTELARARKDGA